jgi:opacity protein-like surface antigen
VIVTRRLLRLISAVTLFGYVMAPPAAVAEWYMAGYGGISVEGKVTDVSMPTLGDARAQAKAAGIFTFLPNDLTNRYDQQMSVSDLNLKNSPIVGAKIGYYFNDYGYRWLGVEVEAFTTQPNVKQQTFQTSQTILYSGNGIPSPPGSPILCGPTATNPPICGGPTLPNGSIGEARLRVSTVAANLMFRYAGKFLEPYAGIGVGVFHFIGSAPLNGTTIVPGLNVLGGIKYFATEHFNIFAEYKYNRATIDGLGTNFGMGGDYQITHVVGGIGWNF